MSKKTIIGLSVGAGVITLLAAAVAGFVMYTNKQLDSLKFEDLCMDGTKRTR